MASLARRSLTIASSRTTQSVVKRFQGSNSGNNSNNYLNKDTPGLSSKVLSVPDTAVGPGASKDAEYKNPEYFCYNQTSYFEAEVELHKYRMPQPSNKK